MPANLKVTYDGKSYNVTQGASFVDEYSEALDSGSVILQNEPNIDFKPYSIIQISGDGIDKEMIVYNVERTLVNPNLSLYDYNLALASETKLLEKVQLPNLTITSGSGRTIWDYMKNYISFYSPMELSSDGKSTSKIFTLKGADGLDPSDYFYPTVEKANAGLEADRIYFSTLFSNRICPEFSWANPTLREVLNDLALVCDCIVRVDRHQITFTNIGVAQGGFAFSHDNFNSIKKIISGDSYADNLRVDYTQGMDQDDESLLTKNIENIGFRNDNAALLSTGSNGSSKIILQHPIYSIKKCLMSLYRKVNITYISNGSTKTLNNVFMRVQWDISPLILLNSKRNILSQDMVTKGWTESGSDDNKTWTGALPNSGTVAINANSSWSQILEYMQNFKYTTLGYDIGSKEIQGIEDSYSQLKGWWFWLDTKTYTTWEAIVDTCIKKLPMGTEYDYDALSAQIKRINGDTISDITKIVPVDDGTPGGPKDGDTNSWWANIADALSGKLNKFTLYDMATFNIEYYSLKSQVLNFSKNLDKGWITSPDGQDNSLFNINSMGNLEYQKVDRIGEPVYQLTGRFDTLSELPNEGTQITSTVSDGIDPGTNIIFYRREYSIYDNYVDCSYVGAKDYILRNYFHSINAKKRAWKVADVDSSVIRKDNFKFYVEYFNGDVPTQDNLSTYGLSIDNDQFAEIAFSMMWGFENNYKNEGINLMYIKIDEQNPELGGTYDYAKMEFETSVAGRSIAFSAALPDNVIAGTYLEGKWTEATSSDEESTAGGMAQQYVMYAPNGWKDGVTFGLDIVDETEESIKYIANSNGEMDANAVNIGNLPMLGSVSSSPALEITRNDYYKDNREIFAPTIQLEACTNDSNLIIGDGFWKASLLSKDNTIFNEYAKLALGYFTYNEDNFATFISSSNIDNLVNGTDITNSNFKVIAGNWDGTDESFGVSLATKSTDTYSQDSVDKLGFLWPLIKYNMISFPATFGYQVKFDDRTEQKTGKITNASFDDTTPLSPTSSEYPDVNERYKISYLLDDGTPTADMQYPISATDGKATIAIYDSTSVEYDENNLRYFPEVDYSNSNHDTKWNIEGSLIKFSTKVSSEITANLNSNACVGYIELKDTSNKTHIYSLRGDNESEANVSGESVDMYQDNNGEWQPAVRTYKLVFNHETEGDSDITFGQITIPQYESGYFVPFDRVLMAHVSYSISSISHCWIKFGQGYLDSDVTFDNNGDKIATYYYPNMFVAYSDSSEYNKYNVASNGLFGSLAMNGTTPFSVGHYFGYDSTAQQMTLTSVAKTHKFVGIYKAKNYDITKPFDEQGGNIQYELVFGVNNPSDISKITTQVRGIPYST